LTGAAARYDCFDSIEQGVSVTRELFWLMMTIILTGVMWIPYVLDRVKVRGLKATLGNPDPRAKPQSAWAQRLYFAHTNAGDNLVLFAPLVLVLDARNVSTTMTAAACAVYFWSRLAHTIVYAAGIPVARTVTFAIGWLACAVLVLAIFRIV
jgi:uncharacterized MAPEG superfamily protein